ncbi:hypothetical protein CEQ90_09970 [Lewinellaceae bacterium SD302]|nr:hypothetical protein CEQ90_09970 [Lewinellaceae bacterium SD302]
MRQIAFLFLLPLLFFNCKSGANRPDREEALYQTVEDPEPSIVAIPLRIEIKELEELIEQQTADLDLGEAAGEDRKLDLKVSKADEPIKIEVFNEQIRYRVPLKLDIAYDLGIAKPKAEGILALDFRSEFKIDSSWRLATQTKLISHEWIDEPKINVAGISLPITSVANYAIRRAEGSVERAIDLAVDQQIALQTYVTDAWNQLQKPIMVSPENQAWLSIRPIALKMTPLSANEERISADIVLEAVPRLTFGPEAPSELPRPFPAFAYATSGERDENFNLNLGTSITYAEAERLAGESVLNETFTSGNRSVTVDKLNLFGRDGKLIVDLTTSGSYNGSIYLSGLPEYDTGRDRLSIDDLDFTLSTKSFLTKSAAWLLKGKLKRQLQDNMNEMLDDNLDDLRKQLEKELKQQELAQGITLSGELDQLGLSRTYLTREGIEVVVKLTGRLDLDVQGLTQLLPE